MAQIDAAEIITALIEGLKLNPARESIPSEIADKILPVFSIKPARKIKIAQASDSDDTTTAIHTTHATKRTFFIGAHLSIAKDVVSNSLSTRIIISPLEDVAGREFMKILYQPVTAGQFSQVITLPIPIELKKNSAVNFINTSGTASIDVTASIFFYEVEPQ